MSPSVEPALAAAADRADRFDPHQQQQHHAIGRDRRPSAPARAGSATDDQGQREEHREADQMRSRDKGSCSRPPPNRAPPRRNRSARSAAGSPATAAGDRGGEDAAGHYLRRSEAAARAAVRARRQCPARGTSPRASPRSAPVTTPVRVAAARIAGFGIEPYGRLRPPHRRRLSGAVDAVLRRQRRRIWLAKRWRLACRPRSFPSSSRPAHALHRVEQAGHHVLGDRRGGAGAEPAMLDHHRHRIARLRRSGRSR